MRFEDSYLARASVLSLSYVEPRKPEKPDRQDNQIDSMRLTPAPRRRIFLGGSASRNERVEESLDVDA